MARPSHAVIKEVVDNGHLYFFLDFNGDVLAFSPLRILFGVDILVLVFGMLFGVAIYHVKAGMFYP